MLWPRRTQAQILVVLSLLAPLPAQASDVQDAIISQLQKQGYSDFQISTTLLGRLRIVAQNQGQHREIVINPRTGEVLRDLNLLRNSVSSGGGDVPRLREEGGGSGHGGDRPRDDRPHDDRPDGSSGKSDGDAGGGSENAGHGSDGDRGGGRGKND